MRGEDGGGGVPRNMTFSNLYDMTYMGPQTCYILINVACLRACPPLCEGEGWRWTVSLVVLLHVGSIGTARPLGPAC